MTIIDTMHKFTTSVQTVVNNGGKTTKEYDRLIQRWAAFSELGSEAQNNLNAAILSNGSAERLGELRALALAEAVTTSVTTATVHNAAADALYPGLYAEYKKVATANYDTIRHQFNALAERFTAAREIVSPDTNPGELINAPEATRKAWAEGQHTALALTAMLPTLATAAKLAGAPVNVPDDYLPLTVGTEGLHRRRVWEAWEADNRWTALLELGATISAPAVDDITRYRRPAPIETRYERTELGQRPVKVDPEDGLVGSSTRETGLALNGPTTRAFV